MKVTKYEYMKYVFVFSNVFTAILVYFLIQRMAERQLIDAWLVLPLTFLAVTWTALITYLVFCFNPKIKKMKGMEVGEKTIAITIVEFIIVFVAVYFLLDPFMDLVFL